MNSITFGNIQRLNELIDPELLQDNEVTQFTDAVISISGSAMNASKRGAWRRNTNYNPASGTIYGLKQMQDGIGNPYWLASVGSDLYCYNSGWNSIKTGLTPNLNFKFVRYNDYNIITNGTDNLFYLGGTLFANGSSLKIARPSVTNIATQHCQGSYGALDASAQYRYILVYASDDLDFSPPSIPFTHYESSTRQSTNATERALYLYNLPVSTDGRVTKKYLFRTKANGQIYYLRKVLQNSDTDFEDSAADNTLDLSQTIEYLNIPLFAKHIVVHKDRLFLANLKYEDLNVYDPVHAKSKGSTTTKVMAGSGLSTTYEDGEVFSIVNHSVTSATGSLERNSIYKYRVEFIDIYGRRTGYQQTEYTTDATSYDYYTLGHIPEAVIGASADFNPECYRKRIWRTLSDGNVFYLLVELVDDSSDPSGTGIGVRTSYQDSTTDAVLATRTVWTDVGTSQQITNPVALAFSDIGTPTRIPLENYREIFADEGGEITGIFDDVNGLLIFKTNAIFKLYTDGSPVNWRLVKLVNGIGCNDPNSIAQSDNTYIFKNQNRIYQYNSGGQITEIGQYIRPSIALITSTKEAIMNNDWYWLMYNISSNVYFLVYNRKFDIWYKFTKSGGNCIAFNKFGSDFSADTAIYTNYGAYIVNYSTGSTIDNETGSDTDISMTIYSKYFRVSDAIFKARLRKLLVNYLASSGKSVNISIYNPTDGTSQTLSVTAGTGWETRRLDLPYTTPKVRKFQLRISGAGINKFNMARVDFRLIGEGYANR